jgi:hypothetical protein
MLTTVSFVVGLVPAAVLWVLYGLRTDWRETQAGRAMFALISVFAVSYLLTVVVLLVPGWFHETAGIWVRIVIRLAVAAVLWNLLRLFLKAQRSGRRAAADATEK